MEITTGTAPVTASRRSQAPARSQSRQPASTTPAADRSRQDVVSRTVRETGSTSGTARAASNVIRGLGEAFGSPVTRAGQAAGRALGEAGRSLGEATGRGLGEATGRSIGEVASRVAESGAAQSGPRHDTGGLRYVPQGQVGMHESWRGTAVGPAIGHDGRLDMSRVTPEMFRTLSPEQRRVFMEEMGRHEVAVFQSLPDGRTGAPNNVNGAEAMRNVMYASGDSTAFAQAYAAAPGPTRNLGTYVPPTIHEIAAPVLGVGPRPQPEMSPAMDRVLAENLGTVMQEFSANGGGIQGTELTTANRLVQRYIGAQAGEDPARAQECVQTMLRSLDGSGLQMTPDNVGSTTGVILGGLQSHFRAIHDSDEESKNAMAAALGGLGAGVSVLGPFGALVGAGLQIAGTVAGRSESRDYESLSNGISVNVRRGWRNQPPAGWSENDVNTAMTSFDIAVDAGNV